MDFKKAFTLTEALVVIAIIAFIAGFGIPNYYKAQERAKVKSAMSQLRMLHKAQKMYFTRHDKYYPNSGTFENNVANINDALHLHLMSGDLTFACNNTGDDNTFDCLAAGEIKGSINDYSDYDLQADYFIQVIQGNLNDDDTSPPLNPACEDGAKSCP